MNHSPVNTTLASACRVIGLALVDCCLSVRAEFYYAPVSSDDAPVALPSPDA